MAVYDRAVLAVEKKEQAEVYNIYLRKAAEIYGVTRTRQIYEKAIEILSEAESRQMCVRFAEMETKLGEIDRARAIYIHASQMCVRFAEMETKLGEIDRARAIYIH